MGTPQKALLIEDDTTIRKVYSLALRTAGYVVDEAEDGGTGMAKILQGGYAVVLLDVMLPIHDGLEILRELKTRHATQPNGPIILLSTLTKQEVINEGMNLGAATYLEKSAITPNMLLACIQQTLDGKPPPAPNFG